MVLCRYILYSEKYRLKYIRFLKWQDDHRMGTVEPVRIFKDVCVGQYSGSHLEKIRNGKLIFEDKMAGRNMDRVFFIVENIFVRFYLSIFL